MQPAGGPGDKVFPPTFAGAVYAIEKRRIPGREQPVRCVLLDSVQSQANRMELVLQEAVDAGRIKLPQPGAEPEQFSLASENAIALLQQAARQAKEKGLPWPDEPLVLKPSEELVKLVRLSQIEATKETGETA